MNTQRAEKRCETLDSSMSTPARKRLMRDFKRLQVWPRASPAATASGALLCSLGLGRSARRIRALVAFVSSPLSDVTIQTSSYVRIVWVAFVSGALRVGLSGRTFGWGELLWVGQLVEPCSTCASAGTVHCRS